MKKPSLLAAALAILSAAPVQAAFRFGTEMTVSGYVGSERLIGFPVLVRLRPGRPEGFSYDRCRADGHDIAFYEEDGQTPCPFEVERWDPAGESLIWVRLPALEGSRTRFLFCFGDADRADAPSSSAVWSASNGGYYAGVWHFGETIVSNDATATTAPASSDSARHAAAHDLSARPASTAWNRNFTRMVSTNGVCGLARVIDTEIVSNGHYLDCGDVSALGLGSSFSVSLWTKACRSPTAYKDYCIALAGAGPATEPQNWRWGLYGFNLEFLRVQTNAVEVASLSGGEYTDAWRHLVLSVDGPTVALSVNGVRRDAKTLEGPVLSLDAEDLAFCLGGMAGARTYVGALDEARLLSTPVSADWAKAEYDAVNNETFVTASPVSTLLRDVLTITSTEETEALAAVTPACGDLTDLRDGQVIELSAPVDEQVLSPTLRVRFAGWKLYRRDQEGVFRLVRSSTENACRYEHVGGSVMRFEWQVVRRVPVSVTARGRGEATIGGGAGPMWCDEGVATVTATPFPGASFVRWTGDTAGIADVTEPTVRLSGVMARSLTAVFCEALRACRHECPLQVVGYRSETGPVLTNFPVLVRLSSARGLDLAACGPDGRKMAFLSPDGQRAHPFEIEKWDPAGESLVWVRVPRLSGRQATLLRFCFGGALDVAQAVSVRDIWAAPGAGAYVGVWHMGEPIDESAAIAGAATCDSAVCLPTLVMDGVPAKGGNGDFSMMVSVDGVAGNGRQIASDNVEGSNHNRWNGNRLQTPGYRALQVGGTFTVSGWFIQTRGKGHQGFFGRESSSAATDGWKLETNINFTDYLQFGAADKTGDLSGVQFLNTWRHVALVAEGETMSLYVDGERKSELGIQPVVDSDRGFVIGFAGDATLHGSADEVRFLKGAASAEWIRAECESVRNADFVAFGRVRNRNRGFCLILR